VRYRNVSRPQGAGTHAGGFDGAGVCSERQRGRRGRSRALPKPLSQLSTILEDTAAEERERTGLETVRGGSVDLELGIIGGGGRQVVSN
jgi:hypothetical protein